MCSIVLSESKKGFGLKEDPNLGQLELPQVDAKTTELLNKYTSILAIYSTPNSAYF